MEVQVWSKTEQKSRQHNSLTTRNLLWVKTKEVTHVTTLIQNFTYKDPIHHLRRVLTVRM